jgi:hypothetical protein
VSLYRPLSRELLLIFYFIVDDKLQGYDLGGWTPITRVFHRVQNQMFNGSTDATSVIISFGVDVPKL